MDQRTGSFPDILAALIRNRLRLFRTILPFAIGFGMLVLVENVAVAKIDQWLPVDSFQAAARYSLYVSAVALWLRLCLVGAAVAIALKALDGGQRLGPGALRFWCLVCLGLALSLLGVDFWSYYLQFIGTAGSDAAVRWSWLATLYLRLLFFYIAVRLLIGALCVSENRGVGVLAAWNATTTLQSAGWFLALVVAKLFVDSVIVELVSFAPVVAPLWFVEDELSPLRYFVGHGIEILAQSCGVFVHVALWIAAARRICAREA